MKYIIILIINLIFIQASYSQIYEIGGFLGGSNIIGDVGEPNFIDPKRISYGGIIKWNRSTRHAWRISGITNYQTESLTSDSTVGLGEISAGIEFNFFDFNLHQTGFQHTPYLYTGLSGLVFKESYYSSANTRELPDKNLWTLAIPIVFGYKIKVGNRFVFGAEIGPRYTFTDKLDGSYYISEDGTDYSFGNLNNNDWYVFTGFTLTYTFGRKPCYCTN